MVKRLMAKTGQYEKDGQTKGEWTEIGVILSNDNGEYALIDPAINLAGVLMKQRVLAQKTGGKSGDRVMVSIFSDEQKEGGHQQSGGSQSGSYAGGGRSDYEDDIPFAPCWWA